LFGNALGVLHGDGLLERQPFDHLVALGVLAVRVLVAGQRLDHHLIVLQRLLELAQRHVRRRPPVVALQVLGVQLYGLGRVRQRVAVRLGLGVREAAVRVVRGEVVRLRGRAVAHRDRFRVTVDGLRVALGREVRVRLFFHPLGVRDVRLAVVQHALAVHVGDKKTRVATQKYLLHERFGDDRVTAAGAARDTSPVTARTGECEAWRKERKKIMMNPSDRKSTSGRRLVNSETRIVK